MTTPRIRTRTLCIALALVALAAISLQSAFAFGNGQPDGVYDWMQTPPAQARTAAGECYVEGAPVQDVCVQWCLITPEGDILPQDWFQCMPQGS